VSERVSMHWGEMDLLFHSGIATPLQGDWRLALESSLPP